MIQVSAVLFLKKAFAELHEVVTDVPAFILVYFGPTKIDE